MRTARAQAEGRFSDEIVALETKKRIKDKSGKIVAEEVTLFSEDEGNLPNTTLDALASLKPVQDLGSVTARNSSQLSDGASASVVMDAELARRKGLQPLGTFRSMAVAGCEPDEMGIGPVLAVPKLLKRMGLKISDIDLWQLNEAFAVQTIFCRDRLELPSDRLNVNGGAISIGHPYGMSGARMLGRALLEAKCRGYKRIVITMCVAGGMGAAALLEI